MNEFVRDSINIINIGGGICGIAAFIIALVTWGFFEGIAAAFIIAVAVISYHFIRKPQVCGTYKVEGKNQIEKKEYSGVLQIKEHGELLSCTWEFGTTRDGDAPEPINGTGLRVGNALAFTSDYTNKKNGTTRPGVALYKIRGNHMSGKWGVVEESNAGFEECWKKRA